MTSNIKDSATQPYIVGLKVGLDDFDLPMANAVEARQLNLNPETASRVGQAINDLLARLPQSIRDTDGMADPLFEYELRKPETLPVPINQLPALPGYTHVRWRQVNQLPGYRLRPIRELGNDVFMAFPCFRAFAEEAKARKFDGHGQVLTISDFTHDRKTINHIAKLIADKGVLLDTAQLDFGDCAPGYRPRIALFMTETWTFKLVQDKVENGAPVDANYIYAWPGGAKFYRAKPSLPTAAPSPLPSMTDAEAATRQFKRFNLD